MADGTKIEWADATLNYINGCSVHTPGCTNCYAMKQAHRFPVRQGLTQKTKGGMVWTGEVRAHEPALMQALKWKRGRRIFWNAHGDTFHENVPDAWIDRLFAVCALTPQHTHMVLTKRSARMREYVAGRAGAHGMPAHAILAAMDAVSRSKWPDLAWPLPNVMLGVSVEDQQRADERRDDLRNTPAAVRFVSYEPALGPVDWTGWEFIDWLISGGESGPKARPSHPDWHREARDFCGFHAIAYLFKQWGEWLPFLGWKDGVSRYADASGSYGPERIYRFGDGQHAARVGKKRAGRMLDGITHDGFPELAIAADYEAQVAGGRLL